MKSRKILTLLLAVSFLITSLSVFSNAVFAVEDGQKIQKISLTTFTRVAGTTVDLKNDLDGNLVMELNSTFSGQVAQIPQSGIFAANLSKTPYLFIKVKSAAFPFQLQFRYKGGEWDDVNRALLTIQNDIQLSGTEKIYKFNLNDYFTTDVPEGTEVISPYCDPYPQVATKSIPVTNDFENCDFRFILVPFASNSEGDKVVVSDIFLASSEDAIVAEYNKVPSDATKILTSTILASNPTITVNTDDTFEFTAPGLNVAGIFVPIDSINIDETPILYVEFSSSLTGAAIDLEVPAAIRVFSNFGKTIQNGVVAIDLRNFYLPSDAKVLKIYNWNGNSEDPSTMVIKGIYYGAEPLIPVVSEDSSSSISESSIPDDNEPSPEVSTEENVPTGDESPIAFAAILIAMAVCIIVIKRKNVFE